MSLPSRYSDAGLSIADQRLVITVGSPRKNRPIGAIKIEERVNDVLVHRKRKHEQIEVHTIADSEGDIPMIGMDDEEEVQIISNFVTEKREEPGFASGSTTQDARMTDDSTPEPLQNREIIMVVDTNFMVSHLDIIDGLAKLHRKYHHTLVIPVTVVRELDGLKGSKKYTTDVISGNTVGHLARWANDWIYGMLAKGEKSVRAQKLREVTDKTAVKDDAILDCCLYFREKTGALVVLLSNDKNLCMKALANEVLTVSHRKGMTAELIARRSFEETGGTTLPAGNTVDIDIDTTEHLHTSSHVPEHTLADLHNHDMAIHDASELIYSEVQKVVLGALDAVMYAEFEDDMELIGYRKCDVVSLRDASEVLIQFWISVFTEYFEHSHIKPFRGKGRKTPRHVSIPQTREELREFVNYWGNVLTGLYLKRDEAQNKALEVIIQRWRDLSDSKI